MEPEGLGQKPRNLVRGATGSIIKSKRIIKIAPNKTENSDF